MCLRSVNQHFVHFAHQHRIHRRLHPALTSSALQGNAAASESAAVPESAAWRTGQTAFPDAIVTQVILERIKEVDRLLEN